MKDQRKSLKKNQIIALFDLNKSSLNHLNLVVGVHSIIEFQKILKAKWFIRNLRIVY